MYNEGNGGRRRQLSNTSTGTGTVAAISNLS